VVSFTPRPLYPQGKCLWYPLDRRLGGPQSHSGRGGEEKNSLPLPGLDPPIIFISTYREMFNDLCVRSLISPFSHLIRRLLSFAVS
jgi:hypothetical protein